MERRIPYAVTLVVVILLAMGGGIVMADEGLTLEVLAESIASLTGRVEALESIFEGPGAQAISDGECAIGLGDGIQDETVFKYKEAYGEWPDFAQIDIGHIVIDSNSDEIKVVHEYAVWFTRRYVDEIWKGCEFVGSSDWREGEE